MNFIIRSPARAWLVVVIVAVTGCRSWQRADLPQQPTPEASNRVVRVVLNDGTRNSLRGAFIQSDSVIGYATVGDERRLAFPLSSVDRVETYRIEGDRTAGLIVGAGLGVLLVVAIVTVALLAIAFGSSGVTH